MRHRPLRALLVATCLVLVGCAEPSPSVDAGGTSADEASAGPGDGTAPPSSDAPSDDSGADGSGGADASGSIDGNADDAASTTDASPTTSPAPARQPGSAPGARSPGEPGNESVDPIPVGTYAYATDGWTKLGDEPRQDMPERTTLEVGPAGGDDVQQQVRDTRDEDGYGSRNTTTLRYGVEGVVLLRSELESTVEVFGSPFTSQERLEARPPVVIAPNGGGVGHHADLHLEGDEVTVDGTLDVVRREQVSIGGEVVDAFVVEVRHRLQGAIEGTSEATWWVRADDLLVVREQVATDVTSRGLRYREQYDAELTSTEPT